MCVSSGVVPKQEVMEQCEKFVVEKLKNNENRDFGATTK